MLFDSKSFINAQKVVVIAGGRQEHNSMGKSVIQAVQKSDAYVLPMLSWLHANGKVKVWSKGDEFQYFVYDDVPVDYNSDEILAIGAKRDGSVKDPFILVTDGKKTLECSIDGIIAREYEGHKIPERHVYAFFKRSGRMLKRAKQGLLAPVESYLPVATSSPKDALEGKGLLRFCPAVVASFGTINISFPKLFPVIAERLLGEKYQESDVLDKEGLLESYPEMELFL